METRMKEMVKDYKENFINECFNVIGEICAEQDTKEIILGSHGIRMKPNKKGLIVPHLFRVDYSNLNNHKEEIELYSEEGYSTIEDIAHWADTCIDYKNCMATGQYEGYYSLWNVKKS